MQNDGVFIPQQAFWDEEGQAGKRLIWFFKPDYENQILLAWPADKKYARDLIQKSDWGPECFQDKRLVESGIRFGKDLWRICVKRYQEDKNGISESESGSTESRKRFSVNHSPTFTTNMLEGQTTLMISCPLPFLCVLTQKTTT